MIRGMTQKTLTYEQLGIDPVDMYEAMGYGGALPDEATLSETQAIVDEVRRWLRPQFCFLMMGELPAFEMGKIIEHQLKGSEAYCLFICTGGVEYEAYQQRLKQEGDMVRVFIADSLGSVIAEKCADQMERAVQESIDKLGWHHTNRFSPGYCGWHVSQQQQLFPLFEGKTCGVRLTEGSLMVPIKSVSGVMGVGRNVSRQDYTCGLCDFEKCYKRKLKFPR